MCWEKIHFLQNWGIYIMNIDDAFFLHKKLRNSAIIDDCRSIK